MLFTRRRAGAAERPVLDDLAPLLHRLLGAQMPVSVRAWDGSVVGPAQSPTTIIVRSPDAIRRLVWSPGELGLGRAHVAGDLDFEGDIFSVLALRDLIADRRRHAEIRLPRLELLRAALRVGALRPPPPAPAEEVRPRGRRHSRRRDAEAVAHHYDVSNAFYRAMLGPSMTYSCALWAEPGAGLEAAQAAKHELVCRKLALCPGMRLLDVGCGWGTMLIHAAVHHGVAGVGVTLSAAQADLARARVARAGVADRVHIRRQDYRDVDDGPYDAISSIGMFEHVGLSRLAVYFDACFALLRPGGRFLNHAIARVPAYGDRARLGAFAERYVFPDAEVHEIGVVVSAMQRAGFEARHMEELREHYGLTLRAWVANLEASWDRAVEEAGAARARIWRLHMAGAALAFEAGRLQVAQVLGIRPGPGGGDGGGGGGGGGGGLAPVAGWGPRPPTVCWPPSRPSPRSGDEGVQRGIATSSWRFRRPEGTRAGRGEDRHGLAGAGPAGLKECAMTVQSVIGGGAITAVLGVAGTRPAGAQAEGAARGPELVRELALTGVSQTGLLIAAGVTMVMAGLLVSGLARRHGALAHLGSPRAERTTGAGRSPPRWSWPAGAALMAGPGTVPSPLIIGAARPFDRLPALGAKARDATATGWRHLRPKARSGPGSMAKDVTRRDRPPAMRRAHRRRRARHVGGGRSARSPTAPG